MCCLPGTAYGILPTLLFFMRGTCVRPFFHKGQTSKPKVNHFSRVFFLCFGDSVVECFGAVARWSVGRWFGGSVVRWFGGSAVRWFGGLVIW